MQEILHHLRCKEPCKYWDTLRIYQLVSLPDFWTINSMMFPSIFQEPSILEASSP